MSYIKWNYDLVKSFIEKEGYTLLSTEYKKMSEKLKMICPQGHTIEMRFDHFKNGHRCKICAGKASLTYEYVKEYIEKEGYILLSKEYKNNRTKLKIQCPEGHIFSMRFNDFQQGQRCRECYNKFVGDSKRYSYDYIKEYFLKYGYKLLSNNYINSKEKLTVECPKGHIIEISFDSFRGGNRCSICKESKGEKEIARILDKMKINYHREYCFDDCKAIRKLPFDFYIPDYNCCIEYDGEQHYNKNIFFHKDNENSFKKRKEYDSIKTNYCLNNNINLIRIPYFQYNQIEEILYQYFKDKLIPSY